MNTDKKANYFVSIRVISGKTGCHELHEFALILAGKTVGDVNISSRLSILPLKRSAADEHK